MLSIGRGGGGPEAMNFDFPPSLVLSLLLRIGKGGELLLLLRPFGIAAADLTLRKLSFRSIPVGPAAAALTPLCILLLRPKALLLFRENKPPDFGVGLCEPSDLLEKSFFELPRSGTGNGGPTERLL